MWEFRLPPVDGGRLEGWLDNVHVGLIDVINERPGVWNIVHTEVFPEYEGQGYGRRLVRASVEWARSHGGHLRASCPYARKLLDRTPEYADVAVP